MIQDSEGILLILATGVLVWVVVNRKRIAQIQYGHFLQKSYYILYISFVCTVFEGLFFGEALNMVEHICYALSMLMMMIWSYKMFGGGKS